MSCDVLIVDDDRDIRDALREILEDEGHRVMTARNGMEALEKLREATTLPRLILLDLAMPVMDGATFREQQRQDPRLAAVPVVVLSAAAALGDKVAALGVTAYLPKPLSIVDLLAAVHRHCTASAQR